MNYQHDFFEAPAVEPKDHYRVLVACEESQAVCNAFREFDHEAYSCDIIDCSGGHSEWHIKQDVLPLLNGDCVFKTCDGKEHKIIWHYNSLGLPAAERAKLRSKTFPGIAQAMAEQWGAALRTPNWEY